MAGSLMRKMCENHHCQFCCNVFTGQASYNKNKGPMKNVCALLIITGGLFVYDMPPEKASKQHHASEKTCVKHNVCDYSAQNSSCRSLITVYPYFLY